MAFFTSLVYSKNTKCAYNTKRDSYLAFCAYRLFTYTSLHTDLVSLCDLLGAIFEVRFCQTIFKYSALVTSGMGGLLNPLKDNFCANNILKGITET